MSYELKVKIIRKLELIIEKWLMASFVVSESVTVYEWSLVHWLPVLPERSLICVCVCCELWVVSLWPVMRAVCCLLYAVCRHRRSAERGKVDLLQRADEELCARRELPLLHNRPERGARARPRRAVRRALQPLRAAHADSPHPPPTHALLSSHSPSRFCAHRLTAF